MSRTSKAVRLHPLHCTYSRSFTETEHGLARSRRCRSTSSGSLAFFSHPGRASFRIIVTYRKTVGTELFIESTDTENCHFDTCPLGTLNTTTFTCSSIFEPMGKDRYEFLLRIYSCFCFVFSSFKGTAGR